MLTPEYLLHATEPAEEIAEQLHIDLTNRIVDRMMIRLKRGDKYLLTATDKWQIETLQQAGFLLEDIKKELANATEKLEKEIAEAMEDAGVRSLEYDDEIYRAAGLDPAPLRQSPNLIRIMQRDYEATMGEWENFTRTTANSIHTEFINACDTAYHQVISGGLSSTQAVAEALDKAIGGGVVVRYPSGHEDTIETATARAVRTGISQATAHITDQRMDEMDWDTILVSSHFGARVTDKEDFTNHYWWQGKFYSKSGKDPRFPPFSVCNLGHVQGIHGANCRHHHGPGDGENNPFQEFDAEENKKQYEIEQKQRTMERRIRKTKRELQNLQNAIDKETDPVVKERFEKQFERKSALLKKQNEAYNAFCEETGQRRLPDRINIAKWQRSETEKRSIKAAKEWDNRMAAKEESPRPIKKENYSVRWDVVQNSKYQEKFRNLSNSEKANQSALVRAKWALNNRDGTNTEELYALDMRTGEEIARITDQQYPNGVMRTTQFDDRLLAARSTGAKIMFIHNHPSGSPPSVGDFNALLTMPEAYGITVGHDGSVYKYTAPKNKILQSDFEVAILRYKRYSYITAYEKALAEIAEKYGFTFDRM